jgi:hypothetical protein
MAISQSVGQTADRHAGRQAGTGEPQSIQYAMTAWSIDAFLHACMDAFLHACMKRDDEYRSAAQPQSRRKESASVSEVGGRLTDSCIHASCHVICIGGERE